jgi:hypothetical protein
MDFIEMKPTYEELKNRVLELEAEAENCRVAEESLRRSNDYETRDYLEGEKIIDIDKASGIGN